jgi:hypothetical protein
VEDINYESDDENSRQPKLTLKLNANFVGEIGNILFNPKNLGSKPLLKEVVKYEKSLPKLTEVVFDEL